jgi:hypothetical protein
MMKDAYGNDQVYLVQPTTLDYEISYGGDGVKTCQEGRYRHYFTASAGGLSGSIRIQLNRVSAERFAAYNGLQLITDEQREEIQERWSVRAFR